MSKAIIEFFAGRESTLDSEVGSLYVFQEPLKRGLALFPIRAVDGFDGQANTLPLGQLQGFKRLENAMRIDSFDDFRHAYSIARIRRQGQGPR